MTNRRNTERLAELEHQYGIQGIAFDSMKTEDIDVFILAMKPKDAEIALATLKRRIQPHQIILSVLAGITTSFIQQSLHDRQPVVRVMPNTSSMIGESATAAAFGDHVSYGSAKPRYPFGMPRGSVRDQGRSDGHFHRHRRQRTGVLLLFNGVY